MCLLVLKKSSYALAIYGKLLLLHLVLCNVRKISVDPSNLG
jgi:hypothetical protein